MGNDPISLLRYIGYIVLVDQWSLGELCGKLSELCGNVGSSGHSFFFNSALLLGGFQELVMSPRDQPSVLALRLRSWQKRQKPGINEHKISNINSIL